MSAAWATPESIATKVRRRWDDGSLLRAYADGLPFERVEIVLPGPTASAIGDDLSAARQWVARLDSGRRRDTRYSLEWSMIGGRHLGRNKVPSRAVISSFAQAWALLEVAREVESFGEILSLVEPHPSVRSWVVTNPHRALERRADLPRLLAAYCWLDDHRHSGRYLREISAPGVDTKFAERHRSVLAAMLGVSASTTKFLADLGLRQKPEIVRLRADRSLGLPSPLSEIAVRADELIELGLAPRAAVVIENEITYLSVPVPQDGVVIWGKGFDVDRVGRLPWLVGVDVSYWGDIDTHGFAILDRLRAWLPQSRSVLMDRQTLLAHRDRWGTEDSPTTARLGRLSPDEADLYGDLVVDVFGDRVRLEQERVDWSWVRERLQR
ncbi:MAG TPA: Wadjet anti-phage system protein JetD domain-containing protein [Microlunatus sp.]